MTLRHQDKKNNDVEIFFPTVKISTENCYDKHNMITTRCHWDVKKTRTWELIMETWLGKTDQDWPRPTKIKNEKTTNHGCKDIETTDTTIFQKNLRTFASFFNWTKI